MCDFFLFLKHSVKQKQRNFVINVQESVVLPGARLFGLHDGCSLEIWSRKLVPNREFALWWQWTECGCFSRIITTETSIVRWILLPMERRTNHQHASLLSAWYRIIRLGVVAQCLGLVKFPHPSASVIVENGRYEKNSNELAPWSSRKRLSLAGNNFGNIQV